MAIDLCCLFVWLISFAVFVLFLLCAIIFVTSSPFPNIYYHEREKFYLSAMSEPRSKFPFPHLSDTPSVDLTVVIPAYNESVRLPPMLDECLEYLNKRQNENSSFLYEVIIVDDGSLDQTTQVALNYANKYSTEKVRVLTLIQNRGKGGAVRMGVLCSRGRRILFADADGATKFSDLEKLEHSMKELSDKGDKIVIVGSRAHLEEESKAKRSILRTFLMYGFHFLVWLFAVRGIKDTQCGFKLFTREAASVLFPALHVERWAFDVELLYLAEELKIPLSEVAVNWTEIEGSKLIPFWSWLQMGRDLMLIWLKYRLGAWKIATKDKIE